MPKKTMKVTAVIACFALLTLTVPTLNAKPRTHKFDFNRFIKKQIAVVTSLLSFLPFVDEESDKAPEIKGDSKQILKITGDLSSGRPSGGD
jgi:hypothetical protein